MGWLSDLFSGSSEQTQTSRSSLTPWGPVSGALNTFASGLRAPTAGLNETEQGAVNEWTRTGQGGHGFADQYGRVANGLLTPTDYGGYARNAYTNLRGNLGAYASGAMLDPANNPYFAGLMTQLGDNAANRINASFAAAGRDMSGANQNAVAQGITEAQLPVLAQMYQQNQDRQFQANGMLQGAGYGLSGLLSNLDTEEANRQIAGIQAGNSAMDARTWGPQQVLSAQGAGRQIPIQSAQAYSGILGDLASRFGEQGSTQTAQTQSSPSIMDMIGQVVGIGATLMGMPGMSTTTGAGTSQMPISSPYIPQGNYSTGVYNPYAGQVAPSGWSNRY